MPWITRSELELAVGADQVLNLARLDGEAVNSPNIDARVARAIEEAESEVKSYIRGRLAADALDPVPPVLKGKVITLAVLALQTLGRRETLTDADMNAAKVARQWLRDYADGRAGLDIPPTAQAAQVLPGVVGTTEINTAGAMRQVLEGY